MPLLRRCRYYDDDGKLVGTGCHREGKGCDFVHPSEPAWSSAPRRGDPSLARMDGGDFRGGSVGMERGRGRGRGRGGPLPGRSGSGSESGSGWDMSSWGVSDTTKGGERVQDGGWGQRGSVSNTTKEKERVQDEGWGQPGGAWGVSDTTHEKERVQDGGWGQPGIDAGAWGDGSSGEWGVPGSSGTGGWGLPSAGDVNKSVRDATVKDGNEPSPGRKDNTFKSLPRPARRPSVDKVHLIPDSSSSWTDGQSNRVLSSPIRKRKLSISMSTQDDVSIGDWSHVNHDNEFHSSSRAPSPTPSELTTSSSRLPSTRTPADRRKKVWKDLISHTVRTVRIQLELAQLEHDRDRWKATQASPCYSHAGSAVRQKLDDARKGYEKNIIDCKKRLAAATADLCRFPEISQVLATNFNPEADEAEAREYISKVKQWIDTIRQSVIDFTAPQPESQEAPPTRESSIEEGQIETSHSENRQSLNTLPQDQDMLISRIQQLEERMDLAVQKLEETFIFRQFTTISDTIYEKLEAQQKQLGSTQTSARLEEGECVPNMPEQYIKLSARASQLSSDMEELVKSTAPVLTEANSREESLKQVKAEHEHLKKENSLMREQRLELEKLLEKDSVLIRQTSEQVQSLLMRSMPRATPVTPSPPLVSNELNESIVAHVGDAIRQDILPLLEIISQECSTHIRRENAAMYSKVWSKLQPTIKRIEAIHNLMEANGYEKQT